MRPGILRNLLQAADGRLVRQLDLRPVQGRVDGVALFCNAYRDLKLIISDDAVK